MLRDALVKRGVKIDGRVRTLDARSATSIVPNPLMAQIEGLPMVSSKWKTLWPYNENSLPFTGVSSASSLMSAPATNDFSPAPVRISTRTLASSRASSRA